MMKPKRRSLAITGAASAVAVLALGASAIASNRSSGRAVQPRTLTVARTGTLTTVVTPGMTKDVTVLDAGTVTILVDDVAGTFKVSKVVVNVGWQADTSVPDGTHAAIAFTATARTVNVTLVLDSGVLTVTIIEVPPTSTPSTSTATTTPSSSSSSTAPTTATTTATTAASTTSSTEATTTVATRPDTSVAPACTEGDDEGDDGGEQAECDDHGDDDDHATTQTSSSKKGKDKHDDDDEHKGHEGDDD